MGQLIILTCYIVIPFILLELSWAEEKQNQLLHRLHWIAFEHARKLLQQEGYVLLSGRSWTDWCTMIKWAQNPKYYQDNEENLISRWFVRRDILELCDIEIHTLMPRDWWYKDKAWLECSRKIDRSTFGIII